jgi:hypothetical protein
MNLAALYESDATKLLFEDTDEKEPKLRNCEPMKRSGFWQNIADNSVNYESGYKDF